MGISKAGNNNDKTQQLSRKARRKQERKARKQKRAPKGNAVTTTTTTVPPIAGVHRNKAANKSVIRPRQEGEENDNVQQIHRHNTLPPSKRQKKGTSIPRNKDPYAHIKDPALAAAMRRDDEEIAQLEAKLGLSSAKNRARLNEEYAKQEGYGDDFGDFLDDLDDMVRRIVTTNNSDDDDDDDDDDSAKHSKSKTKKAPAKHDDSEDENSQDYESDASSNLDDPYHSSEDEENMTNEDEDPDTYLEESMGEEILPLKGPAFSGTDNSNDDEEEVDEEESESGSDSDKNEYDDEDGVDTNENPGNETRVQEEEENDSDQETASGEDSDDGPEHDDRDIYHPIEGEDIYGKSKENSASVSGGKYVPPHLRKKHGEQSPDRQESLRTIERLLNVSLNRLSEDTLLSVAQAIAKLYDDHPKSDLNDCIWKISRNTCVERNFLMTGLTPVYVAALVGVHHLKSSAQLAEHLIELVAAELFTELTQHQKESFGQQEKDQDPETLSKRACNLALFLCYLYNYGVVHCSLLYDFIRKLIESFHEIDVEVLLIFLAHCGRSLRSDDPLALKEIVLEVQKRGVQKAAKSSRVDYMLSAMMDLKNNKRRPQDVAFAEKTSKLRKSIGHIKSKVATSNGKANDNSLRLTLSDVLNAETKGRWWRVGASWAGNQYKFQEGDTKLDEEGGTRTEQQVKHMNAPADEKLLKLAAKYRMNTDIRRSIFCIMMGAADCDDAFEKIVRAGVLKNKNERDTVRVLMECCGNEKTYNKFYEHLASRICEYQSRCRFTFQLAFWDVFKQFDDMKMRKAANLSKLLFSLVVQHQVLKLNVLKAIDMTTPEDLPETATIFLTIFFSNVMEYFSDETAVTAFFESSIHQGRAHSADEETIGQGDEAEALRASFTLFFVQILKASPKYKKGSTFRANLKAAIKACDTENFF
jgi:nucleolar MIF4G domain-containing protein 1